MAILQMGAIVAKISGKIGGQTAGLGRNGQYLKNTGSYKKAGSTFRRDVLSSKRLLAAQWGGIGAQGRASWDAATSSFPYVNRVGDTKYYSGYQLFCKFNGNNLLAGTGVESIAPLAYGIQPPSLIDFIVTQNQFLLLNGIDIDANCNYAVFVSDNLTNGQNSLSNMEKMIRVVSEGELRGGIDIYTDYLERWGRFIVGANLNIRIKAIVMNSGQADEYFWQDRVKIQP